LLTSLDEGYIIEGEVSLEVSVFKQLRKDGVSTDTTFTLDHNSDDIFATFINNIADSFDFFVSYKSRDFLDKFGFVDLVGEFIDNDKLCRFGSFDMYFTTT
jgi:hypothetical protein